MSIDEAFSNAKKEAAKSVTDPEVLFVEANGVAPTPGAAFATYHWNYIFVANEKGGNNYKGVEVAYPGWTSKTIDGMPMGAYIAQGEIPKTIQINFLEMVDKAEQSLLPDSCVDPNTKSPVDYIATLRGSTNPGSPGWFWEFFCPGDQTTKRYSATTGELLSAE